MRTPGYSPCITGSQFGTITWESGSSRTRSLATRFRKAKDYLNAIDYSTLESEIKELQSARKCKTTQKILEEKKALLQNIKNIKKAKERSVLGLKEIDIMLKSLEASITQVEVRAVAVEQVKNEITRTISTLSSAMDKNFKELDEEEILVQKEAGLTK